MQRLFDVVRAAASQSAWSQGVELARAGGVFTERADAREHVLRVRPRAGLIHPTVIVYPDDDAWECDCGGAEDPCAHVAAAAIALRQAEREGRPLPSARAEGGGSLGYRFRSANEGLALERVILASGREEPLRSTLLAATKAGAAVSPTQADVAAEIALGPRLAGVLPRGVVRALLGPLESCADVTLDGRSIRTSREAVGMRAVLTDDGPGFRLRALPEPRIDRPLPDGFALCGGVLREVGPSKLDARERDELLGRGRFFSPDDVAVLVSEILPALEARMPVVIETQRLPRARREPPRIALETQRDGEALSVLATLVYGDPPFARVDAGRLTPLRGALPLRDEAEEGRLTTRLRAALGLEPGRRVRLEADEAIAFVERLARFGATVSGDAHQRFFRAGPLHAEVAADAERFAVRFRSLAAEGEASGEAEATAVIGAWRRGESLVPLLAGGFAPLPAEWLAQHGQRVADLLAARGANGRIARAALPDLARLCDALDEPRPPALEALRALLGDFSEAPPAVLPADLTAALRGYQREGVRWLQLLRRAELGALLADDMGLGKTLQALCAIEPPTLVVAPTSLLGNWRDELARFRPALRALTYHGAERELDEAADVTLTSYALLRRDQEALARVAWNTLVLDEAQAIKNPDSQVARAAFALPAKHRLTLTGTPVENRLDELWSQLHFLNPGLLGGRGDFDERYARPIAQGDAAASAHLAERIRPFVLRRKKRDVAPELPPRTEIVRHCTLGAEQRAVYEAVRAATREDVVRALGAGGSVLQALEALLRMRQACCHPRLLPGQTLDASAKLDLLVEQLETIAAEGHKALVFSQWTALLDLVEPRLDAAQLGFVRLDGSTRDRSEVVARFQADSGPPVFLISLRAGGTGLNLTAADHVFLLDPWWNPAVEEQAADRAHRIGQERPVFIYRMVAEDTVEERILELQQRKRELADAALTGTATAALTRADLLALLEP